MARLPELVSGRARDAVPLRLDGVARCCGATRVDPVARLVGAVLVETRGATRYSRTRSPLAVDRRALEVGCAEVRTRPSGALRTVVGVPRALGVVRRTLLPVVGERCGATRPPLGVASVALRSDVRRAATGVAARVVGVRRLTLVDARTGCARAGDVRRLAPLAKIPDGARRRSR